MSKKKWLWEFSKKIMVICFIVYLVTMLFVLVMMWRLKDITAMANLLDDVTNMLEFAVVGYFGKSGLENVFKIFTSNRKEIEE